MLLRRIANKVLTIIEFPFEVLKLQVKQNECQKIKDNILLLWLKNRAPKCYDRDFEYPWLLSKLEIKKGKILDIGSTAGRLLRSRLPIGVEVNTLNLNITEDIKGVTQNEGDIRKTNFKSEFYDCITCISTLEHIGVQGRYGVRNDPRGDFKAMREMHRLLKKSGKLYITFPYGSKDMLPINKLYNINRTKKLFKGYKIIDNTFIKYYPDHKLWLYVPEKEASKTDWIRDRWYSIAMFVLEKT